MKWSPVAAVLVGAVAVAAAPAATPKPPKLQDWCVTKAERKSAVALRAPDGARIVGVLVGPAKARRGVVLAHENNAGLCNWLPYGRRLARQGYRVLALDLRGFVSSPRPRVNRTRYELDVVAGVRELRRRGVSRVGLIGGSLGSTTVLVAGATIRPQVDAIIAASGPTAFATLDGDAAVASMQVPVLFVAAEADAGFADAARTLYARSASPVKQLAIVPGADHGFQLVTGAANAPNRGLFERFLSSRLGG